MFISIFIRSCDESVLFCCRYFIKTVEPCLSCFVFITTDFDQVISETLSIRYMYGTTWYPCTVCRWSVSWRSLCRCDKPYSQKVIYSPIDCVLNFNLSISVLLVLTNSAVSRDCNISFNLLETRSFVCKSREPKRFADGRQVSSKLSDSLLNSIIRLTRPCRIIYFCSRNFKPLHSFYGWAGRF